MFDTLACWTQHWVTENRALVTGNWKPIYCIVLHTYVIVLLSDMIMICYINWTGLSSQLQGFFGEHFERHQPLGHGVGAKWLGLGMVSVRLSHLGRDPVRCEQSSADIFTRRFHICHICINIIIIHHIYICKNSNVYPLVICYIAMERSTIFHGKIHYFYGHFQ